VRDELANAANHREAREIVVNYLIAKVAQVLSTDATLVEAQKPLSQLGLDSLMAVELVHCVQSDLDLNLPMGSVLGGSRLTDLADSLVRMVRSDLTTVDESDRDSESDSAPLLEPALENDCRLADTSHFRQSSDGSGGDRRILVTGAD
jgi:acyl carrier protein